MNREQRYGAYIGLLIGFCIGLILVVSGCATHKYNLSICNGDICSEMNISSRLELEEVSADYIRDDKNRVVKFHFSAKKATSTPIDTETVRVIIDGITEAVPIIP